MLYVIIQFVEFFGLIRFRFYEKNTIFFASLIFLTRWLSRSE